MRDLVGQREVVQSCGAQHIMEATLLNRKAGNDTLYMAREDGCACQFTDREYKTIGMLVDVSLRSKLRIERGPLCLNQSRGSPTGLWGTYVCRVLYRAWQPTLYFE